MQPRSVWCKSGLLEFYCKNSKFASTCEELVEIHMLSMDTDGLTSSEGSTYNLEGLILLGIF